jgi:hypothetical protein
VTALSIDAYAVTTITPASWLPAQNLRQKRHPGICAEPQIQKHDVEVRAIREPRARAGCRNAEYAAQPAASRHSRSD